MMDTYMNEYNLIQAYYFTINGRDQIKKSLTKKDRVKYKETKGMIEDNAGITNKDNTQKDKEVEEMLETWDVVNCRHCGKKILMLTSRKISIGEDEYFICKSGH